MATALALSSSRRLKSRGSWRRQWVRTAPGRSLLTIKAGSRNRHNGAGSNGKGASDGDYYLRMNGPQIYRWATKMMAKAAEKVIAASGLEPSDVDLFIPHQANYRIIETTARNLDLPLEKVFSNVGDYGNTSAASIPIALCEAIQSGRVKQGDNLVLASFGAGLTWAAMTIRWGNAVPPHLSRWRAITYPVGDRVTAVRSALRREQWRVRSAIDKRLRKGD